MLRLFDNDSANAAVWLAIVFAAVWCVVKIVMISVRRLARLRWPELAESDARAHAVDRPLLLGLPCAAVYLLAPATALDEQIAANVAHAGAVGLILAVGWLIVAISGLAKRLVAQRYRMDVADNYHARSVNTKFTVLMRVWVALVIVVTAGAVLMTFPAIRTIGAGLLASAGVAGLVIGLAARPFVETLLASIQVALTEPIHLDDVLVVEGEWGRVEEITPTYVVLRIWDQRRLILPLTYFISTPFQNWTRRNANITTTFTVAVDYRTPVDAVRAAVKPMIESNANYDGDKWNVQVTDSNDRGITLRILATCPDGSKAWNLKVEIREQLIAWLNAHHPDSLPRIRGEIETRPDTPDTPDTANRVTSDQKRSDSDV